MDSRGFDTADWQRLRRLVADRRHYRQATGQVPGHLTTSAIARQLGIRRATVDRAIRQLERETGDGAGR